MTLGVLCNILLENKNNALSVHRKLWLLNLQAEYQQSAALHARILNGKFLESSEISFTIVK